MATSNPALRSSVFSRPVDAPRWDELAAPKAGTMTVRGTAIKAGFFLAICVSTAVFTWMKFAPGLESGNPGAIGPWLIGAGLGGFVLSLVISFAPRTAPFVGPVYAATQGVFIALLSMLMAMQLGGKSEGKVVIDTGMVFQAASLTFGIAAAALLLYATGVIRLSQTAMKIVTVAIGGVAIYALGMMLFNGVFKMNLPNLWVSASPLGIGFSLFVIGLASFSLVMDYQAIDTGVRTGQPKYMEWYGAFALTVTLVWLYIEILRLLSKLNRRD
ncbi:MAG: Bax inhibitor-1/YccA family protein [Phycisphaerales bacterium]